MVYLDIMFLVLFDKNTMLVSKKAEVKELVLKNLSKYPEVEKHFKKLTHQLFDKKITLRALLEIVLIRELLLDGGAIKNFNGYLVELSTYTKFISRPISLINKDIKAWGASWSEIFVAKKLHNQGETKIEFSPRNSPYDISSFDSHRKKTIFTEVKGLDSIAPAFNILNDKLEAMSLLNRSFKKTFFIECFYPLENIDSVSSLSPLLEVATNKLIEDLSNHFKKHKELERKSFKYGKVSFQVKTDKPKVKKFLMIFSGGGVYKGKGAEFMKMVSVYTRVLSNVRQAYSQLLKNRKGDVDAVKNDRIYLLLNTGLANGFGDKKLKKIIEDLSNSVGINEIVDFKFEV